MTTFNAWLEQEMKQRAWRPADLARAAGLPDATLSKILNEDRKAGPEVCNALAKALDLPPDMVFRKAGLLPELAGPEGDATFGELLDVVKDLTVEDRIDVLEYALLRRRLQARRKNRPANS